MIKANITVGFFTPTLFDREQKSDLLKRWATRFNVSLASFHMFRSLTIKSILFTTIWLPLVFDLVSAGHPINHHHNHLGRRGCKANRTGIATASQTSCFPSLSFQMPSTVPDSLDGWWCSMDEEYAFLGFSYEVTACQSVAQLKKEFNDVRHRFNGRYIRLYGACDRQGFYDDVVEAAWGAGVGVHALIWFGFDGNNKWETRRDALFSSLKTNPKAKFVTRAIQFGSETLFDSVLSPSDLTSQVVSAKGELATLNIPVTVSDMAYGYQSHGGAQDVLDAVQLVDAHILPFFSVKATTGGAAWPFVQTDLNWFIQHANGKKIIFTENGWPSKRTSVLQPNNMAAVASVSGQKAYFAMLDSHCEDLKAVQGGGVGWFFHLYSDTQELGYGLLDTSGNPKYTFAPRINC